MREIKELLKSLSSKVRILNDKYTSNILSVIRYRRKKGHPFTLSDVRPMSFKIPEFMTLLYNSEFNILFWELALFHHSASLVHHGMMAKVYKIKESRL